MTSQLYSPDRAKLLDKRVLLIEDDHVFATSIMDDLGAAGMTVHHAASGSEGLSLRRASAYDVLIVDRRLPDTDGVTVVEEVRRQWPETPILILSGLGMTDDRIQGLKAGADAYLCKPCDPTEVKAQLEALIRRGLPDAGACIRVEDLTIHRLESYVERGGREIRLRSRERQLLLALAQSVGQVVTRETLSKSVWGDNFETTTGLLQVVVARLRRAIDGGSPKPLIHTKYRVGYMLGPNPLKRASEHKQTSG